jgi:hypothetical protein
MRNPFGSHYGIRAFRIARMLLRLLPWGSSECQSAAAFYRGGLLQLLMRINPWGSSGPNHAYWISDICPHKKG